MLIPDDQRHCSSEWRLDKLKSVSSRQEAAGYLADFWGSWIAAPMLGPIPKGGWAQLTLGCLAVEASAWFWRPFASWHGVQWPRTKGPLDLQKRRRTGSAHDELNSEAAFGFMFRLIFADERVSSLTVEQVAEVVYRVFRCGLAHRGLSKNCVDSSWLGVIDSHETIFRHLTDGKQNALSINPERFVRRVDDWFQRQVVQVLSAGTGSEIDKAFKEWCRERWNVPESNWKF